MIYCFCSLLQGDGSVWARLWPAWSSTWSLAAWCSGSTSSLRTPTTCLLSRASSASPCRHRTSKSDSSTENTPELVATIKNAGPNSLLHVTSVYITKMEGDLFILFLCKTGSFCFCSCIGYLKYTFFIL